MTRADRDFQEQDMKFSLTGRLLSESCVALGSNSYCTPGLLFALFSTYKFLTKSVAHLDADSPLLGFFFLFISLL